MTDLEALMARTRAEREQYYERLLASWQAKHGTGIPTAAELADEAEILDKERIANAAQEDVSSQDSAAGEPRETREARHEVREVHEEVTDGLDGAGEHAGCGCGCGCGGGCKHHGKHAAEHADDEPGHCSCHQ